MSSNHPQVEDLEAFVLNRRGPESGARNARVVRHLLSGCGTCSLRLHGLGWDNERFERLLTTRPAPLETEVQEQAETVPGPYDYDLAFSRAEQAVTDFLANRPLPNQPTTRAVEVLLAELGFLALEDQARRVKEDSRFAHPRVVHRLVERSHAARHSDPVVMLHNANLARIAAEACTADSACSPRRLADLLALAWDRYGNALRVSGRLFEADEALARAESRREHGTGDPRLRANLLSDLTSLRTFQRRFDEAIALADEAAQIYRDLGDIGELASAQVIKAIAYVYAGETEHAVRILNRAIPLVDQKRDPHLMLAALHNLSWCYIDLNRPADALSLFSEARELYEVTGDQLIKLRRTWQEGRALRDLGRLEKAEAALLRARQGFIDCNLAYEVAVLSLDLSALYLKMGRTEDVRRTVGEAVPIFRSLAVNRDTLAALLQLRQAADHEQQALNLIRLIAAQLDRMPNSSVLK